MKAVTKITFALGLLAGAALVVPEAAFARGGGGGGSGTGSGGGKSGGGGGKSGSPGGKGGGAGSKGGAPGKAGASKNNKGKTQNFLQDMQRDDAANERGGFLDDATLEVIRTRRSAERGE
jgi:hypothetical protein